MEDKVEIKKRSLLVFLLKSILYRDKNTDLWIEMLSTQNVVSEYFEEIGLELIIDESEGYAFLNQKDFDDGEEMPRLVSKRQLSFPVSLLCVLLRKRLIEMDSSGVEMRLILHRDDIVDMMKIFLPESSNQAKVIDRVDTYINKVIDLGFLRRMSSDDGRYEVNRIIKTFVDADWLSEFNEKLEGYKKYADELS